MQVKIKLIIKAIDGSSISIVYENNEIPYAYLSEINPNIIGTIKDIMNKFKVHEAFYNPTIIDFAICDNEPCVYYTILVPKEYIYAKQDIVFSNELIMSNQIDNVMIRSALCKPIN